MTKTDRFANLYATTITMSAANTLTFQEINMGISLFDKVALKINRMEIILSSCITELVAITDSLENALCQSNQISSLDANDRLLIDYSQFATVVSGAPASWKIFHQPFVKDYSSLPGGGLLCAPKPLYLGMETAGFANPGSAAVRIYFTIEKLKDVEYFELLEARSFTG